MGTVVQPHAEKKLLPRSPSPSPLLSRSLSPQGASTSAHPPLPELLQAVERHYREKSTMSAHFVQVNENALLGAPKKTFHGQVWIRRPAEIRWAVSEPEPSLLISNGKKYWFYTPPFATDEQGQVIEKEAKNVKSQLADALLSAHFSGAQFALITELSPSQFRLVPVKGTAGSVQEAVIEIDEQAKVIKKVKLLHHGGNKSEICLKDLQLGLAIPDSQFTFVAPPHTEVIAE